MDYNRDCWYVEKTVSNCGWNYDWYDDECLLTVHYLTLKKFLLWFYSMSLCLCSCDKIIRGTFSPQGGVPQFLHGRLHCFTDLKFTTSKTSYTVFFYLYFCSYCQITEEEEEEEHLYTHFAHTDCKWWQLCILNS